MRGVVLLTCDNGFAAPCNSEATAEPFPCRYATTRALSQRGARVLFTSRSLRRAQQAAERLQHEGAKASIAVIMCSQRHNSL